MTNLVKEILYQPGKLVACVYKTGQNLPAHEHLTELKAVIADFIYSTGDIYIDIEDIKVSFVGYKREVFMVLTYPFSCYPLNPRVPVREIYKMSDQNLFEPLK